MYRPIVDLYTLLVVVRTLVVVVRTLLVVAVVYKLLLLSVSLKVVQASFSSCSVKMGCEVNQQHLKLGRTLLAMLSIPPSSPNSWCWFVSSGQC